MIVIKSKQEGFRRCGVAHTKAQTEWPNSKFSKEELEILKSEPMLIVVEEKRSAGKKDE